MKSPASGKRESALSGQGARVVVCPGGLREVVVEARAEDAITDQAVGVEAALLDGFAAHRGHGPLALRAAVGVGFRPR